MNNQETMTLAHAEKLFRVLSRIEQAAVRASAENRVVDAAEMYKLVGRLMFKNGLSVLREL